MPSLDPHSNKPVSASAADDGNDKHIKQELKEVHDEEELAGQIPLEKTSTKEINSTSPDMVPTSPRVPVPQESMEGVQIAELLRFAWPKKYMIIAYGSLILTTFAVTLATMASGTYIPYVTSSFNTHSLLTTANVVDRIARIIAYPVIARLSDVFGRAKGFSIATFFILISYVMTAASNNIQTYVASEIFGAIGDVGYLIMQQVFIADTTSLRNRGFWASIPETVSTIPSLYIGTIIAENVLKNGVGWRWGYGMWAIIFPFAVSPLIIVMFYLQRWATKSGKWKSNVEILRNVHSTDSIFKKIYQVVWIELDFFGGFLLLAGLSLFLIPLTLTGRNYSYRWKDPAFIAMIILGVVILGVFGFWDIKFAKKPFVPFRMARQSTVFAASLLGAFDYCAFACTTLFFSSYLQAAGFRTPGDATRIDNAIRVSFQVVSPFVGLAMRYLNRARLFAYVGVPMSILGYGLQVYFIDMKDGRIGSSAMFITSRVLMGIGRSLYQTSTQVIVQGVVDKSDVAVTTAIFFALMTVGGAIGSSIGGALWNNILPNELNDRLPEEFKANATMIFKSLPTALKFPKDSPARDAIVMSYIRTLRVNSIVTLGISIPMLVLMFFVTDIRLDKDVNEDNAKKRQFASEEQDDAKSDSDPEPEKKGVITNTTLISESK